MIHRKNKDKNKRYEENVTDKKRSKIIKITIIVVFIVFFLMGIVIGINTHIWKMLAKDMLLNKHSIVVDTDGNNIATLGEEKDKRVVSYNDMPKNLVNAYVSIEDERFFKHHGVDLKRTASAIFSYVFHFGSSSYGGSTITQQLVKNFTGDSTDSITRKIKEWWKAWQLETAVSKEGILEGYLNVIYVGPNVYGVGGGANYYFNKSVSDLSLAECAYLAGINNSPNSYNPFNNSDNNEKIKNRTKTVLSKMKELGYISQDQYNEASNQVDAGLNFNKGSFVDSGNVYSYHTDALIPEVIEDISKKYNISETFAKNYIELAGLTIKSTQNSSIQKQTEIEFEKSRYRIASKLGNDSSQAAMVIIDHKTGNVVACCGGLGTKTQSRIYNRATQSTRQTGSSSKPIAILAPAIKKRKITGATMFNDVEHDFENGYHPVDYSKPLGKITVRRAVESSQNIPFVEIMEKIGPSTSIRYLKKMGITTLTKKDKGLPLSLGGLDKGISPLEMAGAYSTIANDGKYIEPTFYTKAEKQNGTTAVKTKQKKRRVFSKEVAYILKELLKQPVEGINGTATYCKITGVDVAAKTGTTDENYDRWLCGFTPYYTAVTWYGYDKNETVEFNKRNPAGLIWANVMARIHAGLKNAEFEKPIGITTVKICAQSGKIARTGCIHTYTENFLWLTVPGLCDIHNGSELNVEKPDLNIDANAIIPNISTDIDSEEPQSTAEPIEEEPENNNPTANEIETNTTTNSTNANTNTLNTNTTEKNVSTNSTSTNSTNTNSTNTSKTPNTVSNTTNTSSKNTTTNTSSKDTTTNNTNTKKVTNETN